MPQLVKGGKWVFGWAVVGEERNLPIPPAAFEEYEYQPGEALVFFRGSRTSGGFSLGRVNSVQVRQSPLQTRAIAQGRVGLEGRVAVPPEVEVQSGERLLVVRGSGLALGFIKQGPIYEEALAHAELEVFEG